MYQAPLFSKTHSTWYDPTHQKENKNIPAFPTVVSVGLNHREAARDVWGDEERSIGETWKTYGQNKIGLQKVYIFLHLSFPMPLKRGLKNIGFNIQELMSTGRTRKQSVAIALRVAGKSRWMPRMQRKF